MSKAKSTRIFVHKFGKVFAPIQVNQSTGMLETYITFDQNDLSSLLRSVHLSFLETSFKKMTQRERDIIDFCRRLENLLEKEKSIYGEMISPIIANKTETQKTKPNA